MLKIEINRNGYPGPRGVDEEAICVGGCERQRMDCSTGWARGMCEPCRRRHKEAGTYERVALTPQSRKNLFAETHPIGTRAVQRTGYVNVKTEDGWVPEHRHVMRLKLGRPLEPGENVHHRNGVRDDNRPENLELWYVPQVRGQRVEELLHYLVEHHRDAVVRALDLS